MKEYRKLSHCVFYTNYHLVFVTKYRRKIFKPGLGRYLDKVFKGALRKHPEIHVLESNTDQDHVHLLVSIPPKFCVSDIVKQLKGASARAMKRRFRFLHKTYYSVDGIWSDGYFVSTVGIDEETIRNYIEHQGLHDTGQAKLVL